MAKYPNVKALRSSLDKKIVKPIYLFLGEEEGEKDNYIAEIKSLVLKDEPDGSSGRFHCELGDFLAGVDFALSSSMFSEIKFCVLYNIDAITSEADGKLFSEMINELPDGTYLIATTSKLSPPKVVSNAILNKFDIIQFWRHFENDMSSYIITELKKHGINLESGALNMILERTGKDVRKADEAIEMLISSQVKSISKELVQTVIYDGAEVTIFDFSDLLFQRDKRALEYYKKITDAGISERRVFSEIMRLISLLEKYYSAIAGTDSITGALEACGITEKFRDKFLAFTRSFNKEQTLSLYKELTKADLKRKTTQSGKTILSDPVFSLISDIVVNDTL